MYLPWEMFSCGYPMVKSFQCCHGNSCHLPQCEAALLVYCSKPFSGSVLPWISNSLTFPKNQAAETTETVMRDSDKAPWGKQGRSGICLCHELLCICRESDTTLPLFLLPKRAILLSHTLAFPPSNLEAGLVCTVTQGVEVKPGFF